MATTDECFDRLPSRADNVITDVRFDIVLCVLSLVCRQRADVQRALRYEAEQLGATQRHFDGSKTNTVYALECARADAERALKEREVFLRAQQLDLKRAARDLLRLQTLGLQALRDELQQKEAR